jgi:hypothetical protein
MDSNALKLHCDALAQQGYTLLPGFLSAAQLQRINGLFDQWLGGHRGRNTFEGQPTERIDTLAAREG